MTVANFLSATGKNRTEQTTTTQILGEILDAIDEFRENVQLFLNHQCTLPFNTPLPPTRQQLDGRAFEDGLMAGACLVLVAGFAGLCIVSQKRA